MNVPLELSFRGVEKTQALEEYIQRGVRKLEEVCDSIVSCRIVVEQPQKHQKRGSPYRVRIDLRVPPRHELVIRRESGEGNLHDDVRKVLREAFDAARRQLRDLMDRLQGEVKSHPEQERNAMVVRMFPEGGYGFIRALDGQEIYFHRNSVLNDGFEGLQVGAEVRYVAEQGEEGLQASTVEVLDNRGRVPGAEDVLESPLGWKA